MNVHQKDIVLLPYPFSNFEGDKARPAIVVSNDLLNMRSDDCIIVPVTGVIKDEPYSVLINQENLVCGKLMKPSRVRADKILTIEKDLIVMNIGRLDDKMFDKIKSEIIRMF
jgi:mRNA interferase MazF